MSDLARPLTVADLSARRSRLHAPGAAGGKPRLHAGDHVTDPTLARFLEGLTLRDAAVLIPILDRPEGAGVLLTQRTDHLSAHAGQVAFPGGKIDPEDAGPVEAALRESFEEIGLSPDRVDPLGLLDPYVSNSGYRIFPVVGIVAPDAPLAPNPFEVKDVFEVPLSYLMAAENHLLETRPWRGADRRYYAITHRDRRIWGVTAGIIRLLHEQVFS
jgi:8-oxo-dGTP pyrophosphatase MutT (NUDIX family)